MLDAGKSAITGRCSIVLVGLCLIASVEEPPATSFAEESSGHFQPPPSQLCTYMAYIYFFENKDCTVRDAAAKADPASLRGVNGIYSVYFLHAVHINPQRCQHAAHLLFHSALVFQRSIHHTRTALPKRERHKVFITGL